MSETKIDENGDENLNEFAYTPEEQALLDQLDQTNDDNEELKNLDDENQSLYDDLLTSNDDENAESGTDTKSEPGQEDKREGASESGTETGGQGGSPGASEPAAQEAIVQDPQVEEPAPNFDEELEELDQSIQEAQGKVDDIQKELEKLAEDYDNGDVSQGKYDVERLKLERQLRKQDATVERLQGQYDQVDQKAQDYITTQQQTGQAQWRTALVEFANHKDNELLRTNPNVAAQFDDLMAKMGQAGAFEGLDHKQILMAVRNTLALRVPSLPPMTAVQKQEEKPAKPTHDNTKVPKSLAQMQAADVPDQTNPFAYLDKLSGIGYEKALSELSEADYDRYMNS